MTTIADAKPVNPVKIKAANIQKQKSKRLSKAGEWAIAHPRGIIEVLDWRAVNR